jgi:hypothetical protein
MNQQPQQQQLSLVRINAILAEMTEQRNIQGNRAATFAGELADAQARIAELEARVKELTPKESE